MDSIKNLPGNMEGPKERIDTKESLEVRVEPYDKGRISYKDAAAAVDVVREHIRLTHARSECWSSIELGNGGEVVADGWVENRRVQKSQ